MLKITPISIFSDNYVWLIHEPDGNTVFVVDPGDAPPISEHLAKHDINLAGILITHSHNDHIGGIASMLEQWAVPVYGPMHDAIPEITHPLGDGDHFSLWSHRVRVLSLPGHLPEHIGYVIEGVDGSTQLICGDVLFSSGCGRIFNGTHEQLKSSLETINTLPPDTVIYPAHEYTRSNLAFAKAVEPENGRLLEREREVLTLEAKLMPSLPTTLQLERQVNPFLRCTEDSVIASASAWQNEALTSELAVFTALRKWKNAF